MGGAHRSVGEAMNWPMMPALEPATIPFHSAKWPSASLPSTLSRKNSYLTTHVREPWLTAAGRLIGQRTP